jgi:hypothetical protein
MNIGIFGKNTAEAKEFLENIVGEMKYKEVKNVIKFPPSGYEVNLINGTTYRVLVAGDVVRGHKIDKAYVSRNVSVDFINRVLIGLFLGDVDIEYFN